MRAKSYGGLVRSLIFLPTSKEIRESLSAMAGLNPSSLEQAIVDLDAEFRSQGLAAGAQLLAYVKTLIEPFLPRTDEFRRVEGLVWEDWARGKSEQIATRLRPAADLTRCVAAFSGNPGISVGVGCDAVGPLISSPTEVRGIQYFPREIQSGDKSMPA